MGNESGGMGPEDFGLGGDFDDALAEATGESSRNDDSGGGFSPAMSDDVKPNKMDFSKQLQRDNNHNLSYILLFFDTNI